jgi:hypothetical protein
MQARSKAKDSVIRECQEVTSANHSKFQKSSIVTTCFYINTTHVLMARATPNGHKKQELQESWGCRCDQSTCFGTRFKMQSSIVRNGKNDNVECGNYSH